MNVYSSGKLKGKRMERIEAILEKFNCRYRLNMLYAFEQVKTRYKHADEETREIVACYLIKRLMLVECVQQTFDIFMKAQTKPIEELEREGKRMLDDIRKDQMKLRKKLPPDKRWIFPSMTTNLRKGN